MKNVLIITLVLFLGCATANQLNKLQLSMTKAQVIDIIGEADQVRGSIRNKYDQTIEVWEYEKQKHDTRYGNPFTGLSPTYYWLYFCDGKLVQWNQAGDWNTEANRIYEIRFR
jgi:hypothetical protein